MTAPRNLLARIADTLDAAHRCHTTGCLSATALAAIARLLQLAKDHLANGCPVNAEWTYRAAARRLDRETAPRNEH